jgi:2-desacetyl-2-hydroxyethyl bacteriochlorophyllide A dehydrogenase
MMRALVTRLRPDGRREKLLVTDWPAPDRPTGNQIMTRTIYSGITNGSERNDLIGGNWAHSDEDLPAGWGYQNVGRVVEVGPEARELAVGDLLYLSADHAEYVIRPETGLLIKLPATVDPRHAALFGMASVAMHTCRNADLRMGERVLVVGAGVIGQVATQIAAAMGARATLCDVDDRRLELAATIGAAEEVANVAGEGWAAHVPDGAFDAVIDLAGAPGMEDRLITAARRRGRVLLIAGRRQVSYTFNLGNEQEIVIKQNRHFDTGDLENLCRLVARGVVQIGPLIQDVAPVTEAGRIYDTLRDEPNKLFGAVFAW